MPRNDQGLYTLPPGNPVVSDTIIESNWANTTMDDLATAITGSLPVNGVVPMTGPLTLVDADPTYYRQAASKGYVDKFLAYATGMPLGSVIAYASGTAPPGFLLCNGQPVSRTTYADLFAVIGTTYGAGDNATTFNVPDLRDYFIRGKGDARALGSTQAGSLASHSHPVSDPGHTHTVSFDSGLESASHTHSAHTLTANAVGDHTHTYGSAGSKTNSFDSGTTVAAAGTGNTSAAGGHSHTIAGNTAAQDVGHRHAVSGTTASKIAGVTVAAAGGTETVPQNMALDYYIKAVADSGATTSPVLAVTSSDPLMISVDETDPQVPLLTIHSDLPFGVPKLDTDGKIKLAQLPGLTSNLLGFFDASSGQLPSGDFASGDTYFIAVAGDLDLYDPVTLTHSVITVSPGDKIIYVSGSATNPTGWYLNPEGSGVTAADVSFAPTAQVPETDVQAAIAGLGVKSANTMNLTGNQSATGTKTFTAVVVSTLNGNTVPSGTATVAMTTGATGSLKGPAGTTAERDAAPAIGYNRFNTDLGLSEVWDGTDWISMGSGGGGATGAFLENDQVVAADYTITAGKNAVSAGPIVINDGVVVTVPTGATWVVV